MKNRSRAYELHQKIHASNGMQFLNRRKRRAFSLNIFSGNFHELRRACEVVENPEIGVQLMSKTMKDVGTHAHMEVMRLFHNFLASAKSLIDHTRVFVDEHYENTPLKHEYEEKIKSDFASDPLIKFVQDMRNYMVHRGMPSGSMSLTATRNPETNEQTLKSTVSIDRDRLLDWSGWTKPSMIFIQGADARITISSICNTYSEKIINFYQWFDQKLYHHHEVDIEEFNDLQQKYVVAAQEGSHKEV